MEYLAGIPTNILDNTLQFNNISSLALVSTQQLYTVYRIYSIVAIVTLFYWYYFLEMKAENITNIDIWRAIFTS